MQDGRWHVELHCPLCPPHSKHSAHIVLKVVGTMLVVLSVSRTRPLMRRHVPVDVSSLRAGQWQVCSDAAASNDKGARAGLARAAELPNVRHMLRPEAALHCYTARFEIGL